MTTYAVFVVTSVIIGFICAAVAKRQGKNPTLWFLVGAVLNVLVLALVYFFLREKGSKR
jgi:small-conductance mechanosensitive channel